MARYGPIRTRSRRAATVVLLLIAYLLLTPVSGRAVPPGSWKEIFAGKWHTCAIASDDSAWCWGDNEYGQLGNGTSDDSLVPVPVDMAMDFAGWEELAIGYYHTCGIAIADHSLWCWGYGGDGALGRGDTDSSDVPLQTTAAAWATVTAGVFFTCALTYTSEVAWCWGDNLQSALGDGNAPTDSYSPIAVDTTGSIPDTYASIVATSATVCGISSDGATTGTAWCWGDNGSGQLGIGVAGEDEDRDVPQKVEDTAMGEVVQIDPGISHTCAIATDGAVWCWGKNFSQGLIGDGTTDPTSSYVPAAIVTGTSLLAPYYPDTYSAVSVGEVQTCAIAAAGPPSYTFVVPGTVWCWGYGGNGNLGNGSDQNSGIPVPIASEGVWPTTYSRLSTGWAHSCAIASDGDFAGGLWCWGYGPEGLGNGLPDDSAFPAQIGGAGGDCTTDSTTSACHQITYEILSFRSISLSSSDAVDFETVRQGRTETESGPSVFYATTWGGDVITVELDADSPTGIDLLFDVLSIAAPTSGGCSVGGAAGTDQTSDPVVLSTSAQTVIDGIDDCGQGAGTSADDVTATTEFTLDTSAATDTDTDYTTPVISTVTYTIDAG